MHINLDNSTKYNLVGKAEKAWGLEISQLDHWVTRPGSFPLLLKVTAGNAPSASEECETGGKDSVAEAEEEESTCWPSSKGDKK